MRRTTLSLALIAVLALAACESDEEAAQRYFASGLELYEAGDTDRALVEFRNALEHDGNHLDARLYFARISAQDGNDQRAIASYLRVVEQNPDILEGRVFLAEAAALAQSWDEAERHGRAAVALAPDDPHVQALEVVLDYRQALLDGNDEARSRLLARATDLSAEASDSAALRNVLIDGLNWRNDFSGALEQVDAAIALEPRSKALYYSRLSILGSLGDEPAIEAHLREMVSLWPEDDEIKAALIRYLLATGDPERAEEFFRGVADPEGGDIGIYLAFIRFLSETRGDAAAIAELDRTADTSSAPYVLRSVRAGLRFDAGQREAAIEEMEAVLADGPPAGLAGDLKVALAQMLLATGNEVGARQRVEEVLEAEPGNVEALKMSARWLIEADEVDEAIAAARRALNDAPEDIEAMDVLATAYFRAGNHELGRDGLARAVAASNNAPGPTLRFAAILVEDGELRSAEDILVDALRQAPDNIDLLAALGQVYVLERDIARGRGVERRLEAIATPAALEIARELDLELLSAEGRNEELIAVLEARAEGGDADVRARTLLIRARLAEGDVEGALALARSAHEQNPEDYESHLVYAAALAAVGRDDQSDSEYRRMIEAGPADGRAHRFLVTSLLGAGAVEPARRALDDGLQAFPDDLDMLWISASLKEQSGDIDGAIAVYEDMYAIDSSALVIANNLASLLATWRFDDAASVERAFDIARRLRGTDVPAFRDTYGWILHLRGESEAALPYLRDAAEALADDAVVQYHYGMALLAAERTGEGVAQLQRALALAGDDSRPQFEIARAALAEAETNDQTETNVPN